MLESFQKAVQAAKAAHYPSSLALFTQFIENYPNNYTGYLNRGTILLLTNQYQSAIQDFTAAIQIQPLLPIAYYNRFIASYRNSNKTQAQKDLYVALSLSYTKRGQQTKEIKWFNKALSLVENNVSAYVKRGNLYREHSNYTIAESDYTGALEYDHNNISALSARASLYKLMNREEEAAQDLEAVMKTMGDPDVKPIVMEPNVSKVSKTELEIDIQNKLREFQQITKELLQSNQKVSKQNESENRLKIFNSFQQQSNAGSTNEYLTYKTIETQGDASKRLSVNLQNISSNSSKAQSHITQKSQEYKGESFTQLGKIPDPIEQADITEEQTAIPLNSKIQISIGQAVFDDESIQKYPDLYIECTYSDSSEKSQLAVKEGDSFRWNETFLFNYTQSSPTVTIRVLNKETFKKDTLICQADISIINLLRAKELELCNKQKQIGTLKLSSQLS